MAECVHIKSGTAFKGKQGLTYFAGIAAETTGATGICMHVLEMQPGTRAKAHYHAKHETAIFMLEGHAEMLYGGGLEHKMKVGPGDFIFIPPGVPHLPYNPGAAVAKAVVARTDPNEQESVVLCPELDDPIAHA